MSTRELFGPTGTWETETSAAAMLVVGTWFVLDSFTSETPSAPESVLLLVAVVGFLGGLVALGRIAGDAG